MAAVVGALASRFKISLGGSGGRKVTSLVIYLFALTQALPQMMDTKLQGVGQQVPVCCAPSINRLMFGETWNDMCCCAPVQAALERQTLDAVLRLDGGMPMIFVPRASIGFSSRI